MKHAEDCDCKGCVCLGCGSRDVTRYKYETDVRVSWEGSTWSAPAMMPAVKCNACATEYDGVGSEEIHDGAMAAIIAFHSGGLVRMTYNERLEGVCCVKFRTGD